MIPDNLIDKAAQALQDRINNDYGLSAVPLEELPDPWLKNRRTEARTALEAVAADIWDEAHEVGWLNADEYWRCDGSIPAYYKADTTPNPYRASETA